MQKFVINFKNLKKFAAILLICLLLNICGVFSEECTDDQWVCDNGDCIALAKKCDGIVDCSDGSDEIAENCIHLYRSCQNFAFTCTYGACITKTHQCNGIKDCSDNSDELICTSNRFTDLQGKCNSDELQCLRSKECIGKEYMCDGERHCSDGSDETVEVCADFKCPEVGFHCGYGGCINRDAKCNGTIECNDGSDEAWELCGTPRKTIDVRVTQTTSSTTRKPKPISSQPTPKIDVTSGTNTGFAKCQIPLDLGDVTIKLHPFNRTILPGTAVDDDATIHVECNSQDSVKKSASLYCDNGNFNAKFPTCSIYCDGALIKGISTTYNCYRNGHLIDARYCNRKITPGLEIDIICAAGFKRANAITDHQRIRCLPNGQFDDVREKCILECGMVQQLLVALSRNGINVNPNDVPWHVGIYELDESGQYAFICGGSIISPTLVLSAGHCFWNKTLRRTNPPENYQFIAGKYTRSYSIKGDERPQIRKALSIETSEYFRGTKDFSNADAALIKLKEPFIYNDNISSVCISLGENAATDYIGGNILGSVTGYGQNSTLERVPMKTIDFLTCAAIPAAAGLTNDKFCLSNEYDMSICRGDSGGGFVVEQSMSYSLWGIISYTPSTTLDCARDGFVSVTNVRYIKSDLKQLISKRMNDDTLMF